MKREQHGVTQISSWAALDVYKGQTHMLVDSEGIMWVATTKGLNRYDPVYDRFIRYYSSDSNLYNIIWGMLELDSGELLLATQGGIALVDKVSRKLISAVTAIKKIAFLDGVAVKSLAKGANSSLWFGSTHQGLYRFNLASKHYERFHFIDCDSVTYTPMTLQTM